MKLHYCINVVKKFFKKSYQEVIEDLSDFTVKWINGISKEEYLEYETIISIYFEGRI
ncbi:MAG: hypothetical protein LBV03_03580 [Fusobacteriales bacterium]|jgi:hypothetical protein|nr:hypothetical protein [Fusobacteriales bacterium]